MRALLLALIAALALASLSGCQAARVGRLAVGVNAEDEPVLVMASCSGSPYAISVWQAAEPDPALQHQTELLRLENDDPRIDDPAAVSLSNPDDRWTEVERNGDFETGMYYEAMAWPDNDENLGFVRFDLARLNELGEDEVLYQDSQQNHVVPVAEFIDLALDECESL
ncbi:hypothetical protein [Glycomyces sp. NPDC048151]|uniref:hypothetical protein n=1 Tax=Glycomyces sp. NPDC048151 TaxID=3364002 RepID=UPI0037122FD0